MTKLTVLASPTRIT